jgi:alpha-galactosidase-like protein/gametolysin peptidase M11
VGMAACNRRCRFRFNLLLGLSFILLAISASEGTARSQPSALQAAAGAAVDVEGEFVIIHQDFRHSGRYLYFLNTPSGQVPLHFNSRAPTNLLTGTHVRAHGTVDQNGTLILASGGSVTTTSTTTTSSTVPLPSTFGEQLTAVILVNFQDAPTNQPWTPAQVQAAVFGSTGANGFMQENSFGQTWLTGDVFGWYTIPLNSTTCNSALITSYANSAATAAGVNLSSYTHYVYVFPYDSVCGWGGAAQIGGTEAWVNGTLDTKTFTHELGHNLGLYHSHGLYCGLGYSGSPTACSFEEYGDIVDTMGEFGHYNAFQKERLGWLNYNVSPPITAVSASGTYTIDPYETVGTNPKGLKILKSIDPTAGPTWYYVEYRQQIGFDSSFYNCYGCTPLNFYQGVTVHMGTPSDPNSSDLLDMTPGSSTYDLNDAALVPGASYTDPNAGVTITTEWANATNAGVNVTLTTSCPHANPTVAISPTLSPAAQAGRPATFTASVTNNDNSVCTGSSFNLAATVPSGWSAAFGSSSLTLNPGASASTSLTVTSASSAAAGLYSVSATAQNASASGYTSSASATYEVAPSIAVSTNSSSYSQGNSIYVTTIVKSGGSPVPGTSVNCTVTGPSGTKMSATGTTGTNGTTSVTFKLKRSASPGIYQALSVAAANGVSGSGATNFTVQ